MRMNVSKSKVQPLNMNVYRNLHFHSLNYQKKAFKELVEPLLRDLPRMEQIELRYQIFPKTKRLFDVVNVGSIVDKYFSDALSELKIIPDDNYRHIPDVRIGFGGFADEEYVLVTITETKGIDMKLSMTATLTSEEIQQAVAAWISDELGQTITPESVDVSKDASVLVSYTNDDSVETSKPKAKRRTKAQIEADNKAAEEAENVATSGETDAAGSSGGATKTSEEEAPSTDTETKAVAEVKESKNLGTESAAASSTSEDTDEEAEASAGSTTKVKKSSIFDDD